MKVAIIGSGASGLVSIKTCIEEGLQPVCFEQEDTIGGLWYFTPDERHSSVYRSIVINTSKEMMCFSDFPIPKEFPPFMHHSYVMKYFHLYAKHFDLYKYIRFRTKVLDVKQASDFETTGNWELYYEALGGPDAGVIKMEVYNAVMMCVGHHSQPYWPTFAGMNLFQGTKLHSHAYKDFKGMEGKSVLIIGIGNSGGDIATELSRHASKVYLSTRRGSWVLSRLHESGLPFDHWANSRCLACFPYALKKAIVSATVNKRFDHEQFGLKPDHHPFSQHPMVNDDLPNRILNGTVIVKPNIKEFTKTGVLFEDGTADNQIDIVILCTGYNVGFNCIDKTVIPVNDNEVTLYKYVFPPHLSKPTIAILGCFQPLGAINPVVDLQTRWVTRVFKGTAKLPPEKDMIMDINSKKKTMSNSYYASRRHTIQVGYVSYSDEIAELIGCKPSMWKLLFSDPVLAFHCFFGPCTPPQYRLTGPGVWKGAREAILNADANIHYSTKSRALENQENKRETVDFVIKGLILFMAVVALVWKVFM